MESPNRSRALLALVMVVALFGLAGSGSEQTSRTKSVAEQLDAACPLCKIPGSQPARQSVALEVLNRTASVPGE